MSDVKFINQLLNDIWNFHFLLFGILITVFTVLYSFILSKRDELRSLSDEIKNNHNVNDIYIVKQRHGFAKLYILKLNKINKNLSFLIVMTFLFAFLGWVTERLIIDFDCKLILFYFLSFCTISTLIYLIVQSVNIYKDYLHNTKI